MGMRTHTVDAASLNISMLTPSQLVELYGDEFDAVSTDVLVIEDDGNQEALVITGAHGGIAQLVADLVGVALRGASEFGAFAEELAEVLATESEERRGHLAIALHGKIQRVIDDGGAPGARAAMDELLTKVFKI